MFSSSREEYDRVRKMLGQKNPVCNAFVVTGHPGIGTTCKLVPHFRALTSHSGKTTFLIYLLLYRLIRKLPTAIQLSTDFYLLFDIGPLR